MSISVTSLLNRMEQEITFAKNVDDKGKLKNHIYSIKTLCEIILSNDQEDAGMVDVQRKHQQNFSTTVPSITLTENKPLKTDDGANGESIFDF
ncbi:MULTISPECIES: YwdI family protein [Heyndrickxia]|uniref:YwdI family protein n=1 Tax=Heyndrickxia oleronia TaxID=38875 RepID=A0AAW6T0S7_9BACI|nr:YwdI family protein [Heyndrickxia oleronia]OJH16471.1 hypothetical protein BLX88_23175 [Bacillus obstructivus]MCI1593357.1 YwdI family protein [Heyndrickxia oleronia]MCI1615870.1 YwdI family protein [Heyndrickxia oleronia]MCI1746474.1 YwdI family protein [Heyndrickxia oleronia]MCI1764262.1 YwdI family protein [Heyndrickxia oleronia]